MIKKKNIALIGASSGIGVELQKTIDISKYNIIKTSSKNLDITSKSQTDEFFQKNKVDILINLAGKKYDFTLNEQDTYPYYKDMINVNIIGSLNLLSSCLNGMRERNYGRIIMISSVFSVLNIPKQGVYSATKTFLDKIVKTSSLENIRHGITSNTIQLGYCGWGMGLNTTQENIEKAKSKIGLKRFIKIEELYSTIEYIINNEYITGQNIRIDGGIR
jgi:NAD(P)-dependent dehydrogenase (short-subunit alcohol dehydrogenase family)